jgi:quinol-cytochrome oxidoreductase complex cytochrome b subunit
LGIDLEAHLYIKDAQETDTPLGIENKLPSSEYYPFLEYYSSNTFFANETFLRVWSQRRAARCSRRSLVGKAN